MAHFAQIDHNNAVLRVIAVQNTKITDGHGEESEELGVDFCKSLLGGNTRWVQASYNHNFRGCYPGIGYIYDEASDCFIPPQKK